MNAPVEKVPDALDVAVSPPDSVELVPYATPRVVALSPPVAVMLPFAVAVVTLTEEADCVVTVGTTITVISPVITAPVWPTATKLSVPSEVTP